MCTHHFLHQVHLEYKQRLTEAEMLERHIIQARARATAEEERVLNLCKVDIAEEYQEIELPPGEGATGVLSST